MNLPKNPPTKPVIIGKSSIYTEETIYLENNNVFVKIEEIFKIKTIRAYHICNLMKFKYSALTGNLSLDSFAVISQGHNNIVLDKCPNCNKEISGKTLAYIKLLKLNNLK